MKRLSFIAFGIFIISFVSCKKDTSSSETNTNSGATVPDVYKKIYGASDIYISGNYVIIETSGTPDHKSPYYIDTQWEATLYEAYNGSNTQFHLNPNRISEFNFTYKIPLNPSEDASHTATPLGSIGVSLNGVAFYNQYAGPNNEPLTDEINSFDQFNGHPQQQGNYHYHLEPTYLTANKGQDALLGFLLDGFPVYGPMESGQLVQESDLDDYHGHKHATTDYPDGTYHYHITSMDPYINGNGFYGVPGTVSQ
jgi:hypothetical protein